MADNENGAVDEVSAEEITVQRPVTYEVSEEEPTDGVEPADEVSDETADDFDIPDNDFGDDINEEDIEAADDSALPDEMKGHAKPAKRKGKNKTRGQWKKIRKPLIIGVSAAVLAALCFFGYALSTVKDGRIMQNVYIEGVNVGGMTYDEALAAINSANLFTDTDIVLTDGETEFTMTGADIGLAALPEETAQKAVDYCKDDNIFIKAFLAGKLIFTPHEIVPVPQTDETMLGAKLDECGNLMKGERKEHYIEFNEEQTATVFSGQTGYNGDHTKAYEQVVNALQGERFKDIHVDFDTSPPENMTIERLDAMIYKDPVNAEYVIDGNSVSVTDGATGRYIDKEAVTPLLANIYEGCEPVNIPYNIAYPDVSSQTLNDKLFANTLSTYSTSYGGSTSNRCKNVARAAELINGTVVAPGEVFSFNDTVGHRTVENGFYTAKEYINGESVDGIGGGTCQVSSTLYSAVLYADMGIVERLNHMMTVGYIPLGQDATVADGGVDFRFRNTSDYPIKVSAYTDGSNVTVSIIGTAWEPARKVTISNNTTTKGENTVVYSTRYVYENDSLISTDTLNSSTYMPHNMAAQSHTESNTDSSYSSDDDSDYDSNDDSSYDDSSDDGYDEDYEDEEITDN